MIDSDIDHFSLPNGIDVVIYPVNNVRAVAMTLGLKAGSIHETSEKYGSLHFLEHMLFNYSTKIRSSKESRRIEEKLVLDKNASVGTMNTKYWFKFPDVTTKDVISYLYEMFTKPDYDKELVESTRKIILAEYAQYFDSRSRKYYYELYQSLYPNSRYFRLGFGSLANIKTIKPKDIKEAYYKFYFPQNIKIVISGNVSRDKVRQVLTDTFGKFDQRPGRVRITNNLPVHRKKASKYKFHFEGQTVDINLLFPIPGFNPKDPKMLVTKSMIAYYLNTELFSHIRESKGLVYSIGVTGVGFPNLGELNIYCTVPNHVSSEALIEIVNFLKHLKSSGISTTDFKRIKNYLNLNTLVNFSDLFSISSSIVDQLLNDEELKMPDDFINIANELTKTDIDNFMKKYLDFPKMHIGLMGIQEVIDKL